MGIRRIFAINTAKIIKIACQKAGKQGVTLAGKIARKIDPSDFDFSCRAGKRKNFCSLRHKWKNDDE